MGMKFPGRNNMRSAPYSKPYAAGVGAAVDLTDAIPQAKGATSGLICIATATTVQLVYKDCSGTSRDTGSVTAVVGDVWDLPIGATELTTNTGLLVIAYWHETMPQA